MKHRKRRLLILFTSSFLFATILTFLLTRQFTITPPVKILNSLKKSGVDLQLNKLEIKVLPYPHFFIKDIEFSIDNKFAEFTLKNIHLNLNILSILQRKKNIIQNITIENAVIKVNNHLDNDFIKDYKNYILNKIIFFTKEIPKGLLLGKSLFIDRALLYVGSFNFDSPLIDATNISLSENDLLNQSDLNILFKIRKFAGGSIQLKFYKKFSQKKKQFLPQKIEIRLSSNIDLKNITDLSKDIPILFRGKVNTKHNLTINFPFYEVKHEHTINTKQLILYSKTKNFTSDKDKIIEEKNLHIHFSGTATNQNIITNNFLLKTDNLNLLFTLNWFIQEEVFQLKFLEDRIILKKNLTQVLKYIIPKAIQNHLLKANGYILPDFIEWMPWKEKVKYGFFAQYQLRNHQFKVLKTPLIVKGYFYGYNQYIYSKNLAFHIQKSSGKIQNFQFSLLNYPFIQTQIKANIFLKDFNINTTGEIGVLGNFNCFIHNNIYCKKENFFMQVRDIQFPLGWNKTLARLLALQKNDSKRFQISQGKVKGFFIQDTIVAELGSFDMNLGKTNFSGKYQPIQGKGDFKFIWKTKTENKIALKNFTKDFKIKLYIRNNKVKLSNINSTTRPQGVSSQ